MAMKDYLREKLGTPSKLEKLTIVAYAGKQMPKKACGSIIATFNPEAITFSNNVTYKQSDTVESSYPTLLFKAASTGSLSLKLIFDAGQKSQEGTVDEQILQLRMLCTGLNPQHQETNYLSLKWGKMRWGATESVLWRANSLSVVYTLFARDGTPLRAEATLQLIPDPQDKAQHSNPGGLLTSKVVRSNDLLPVLAAAVGTQSDYLMQARENLANSINLPTSAIGSTLVFRKKWL